MKICRNSFKPIFLILFVLAFSFPSQAAVNTAKEIDVGVDATLDRFKEEVPGAEYGEGALRVAGKTIKYYSTAAASIGFQFGAQAKSIILIFTQKKALETFQKSDGWEAGVDGSVALITLGMGDSLDTTNVKDPIVAFIFGQKGLMYNLTLEGSKFSIITPK